MRNWIVFPVICLLPALLLAQPEKPKVRVGAGYSVPWAYLAPDGTPTGLYVEAMREAARREGLDFEIVFRKDGPEKALKSGEIDVWAAAVPTDARRKTFYFTSPWWTQDHYLGVLSSSAVHGVDDLPGKLVVHSTTPPFTADLATALPGANLKPIDDLRARFAALCDGSADAVLFCQETSLFSVTGSSEFADCRERGLRLIPLGRTVMETAIAALPEKRALADRLRAFGHRGATLAGTIDNAVDMVAAQVQPGDAVVTLGADHEVHHGGVRVVHGQRVQAGRVDLLRDDARLGDDLRRRRRVASRRHRFRCPCDDRLR